MRKRILLLMTTVMLVCLMGVSVMASSVKRGTTVVTSITPNTTMTAYSYAYNQADVKTGTYSTEGYGAVIPVRITSSGLLQVNVLMNAASTYQNNAYFCLYKDAACTTKADGVYPASLSAGQLTTKKITLPAGIYYLRLSSDKSYSMPATFVNYGAVALRFVSNANRNLANNTATLISNNSTGTYLKITTPQAGYVTVTGTKNTYVSLFNSSKVMISNECNSLKDENGYKATFAVNKGTYYIRTKNSAEVYAVSYKFAGVPTWKSGKSYTLTPADGKQNMYAKYKPSKSGYVTMTFSGKYGAYVTLCDSKKKALTTEVYTNSSTDNKKVVFAVKKNTTYYIKVKSSYGAKVTFKPVFTSVSEKSGSKVSKAVTIKKGKTAKGLILPSNSTKDYYKIVVSKAQKVSLQFTGKVSTGTVRINVYSDKKLKRWCGTVYINTTSYNKTNSLYTIGSTKLKKGTYYFQVERSNSKTNGYYSIKWK